jgi:hypothetical protein
MFPVRYQYRLAYLSVPGCDGCIVNDLGSWLSGNASEPLFFRIG